MIWTYWPDILAALTCLTDFLDDNVIPIDYDRRRHLDYRVLLPSDQWHRICRRTGFPPGRRSRLDLARCLLFKKISTAPLHWRHRLLTLHTINHHRGLGTYTRAAKYPDAIALVPRILNASEN
jgi:hypothetical protein